MSVLQQKNSALLCPCDSKKHYDLCCGRFVSGNALPQTAEALMRSRYTAYTQANIRYIEETMRGKAAVGFNPEEALQWAQLAKWKRLKVLNRYPHESDKDRYYVEFTAYYIWDGKPQSFTEVSEFQKINGKWYYVDAKESDLLT
jgi:SEC-C motif-containing protein